MSDISNQHSVFVVDSDLSVALTLVRILKVAHYDATPFTDSSEALMAAHMKPPQLLLAEISMPSISGIELAARMRECSPSCQVLLMSGDRTREELIGDRQTGGFDFEFLEKPLGMTKLLGKVQFLLQGPWPPCSVPYPAPEKYFA